MVGAKTAANAYARKLEGKAAAGLLRSHERIRWRDSVDRFSRDDLVTLAASTQTRLYANMEEWIRRESSAD